MVKMKKKEKRFETPKEYISLSFIKQFIKNKKATDTLLLPEHELSNTLNLFIKTKKATKNE